MDQPIDACIMYSCSDSPRGNFAELTIQANSFLSKLSHMQDYRPSDLASRVVICTSYGEILDSLPRNCTGTGDEGLKHL
jgi:hypothetical protein